jgi:hypothetical protein
MIQEADLFLNKRGEHLSIDSIYRQEYITGCCSICLGKDELDSRGREVSGRADKCVRMLPGWNNPSGECCGTGLRMVLPVTSGLEDKILPVT